ncbi:MAG: hypothetical protein JNJ54_04095 [Myxococcaceae bacterium]|nr:hypothetical protein [Myxococcaceae bacterium]
MRSLLLAVVLTLAAVPAWATGERVLLTGAAEPFRETLCVSMTCVRSGARDAVVSARPVKGGVELTVKSASGQVKLVHVAPLNEDGALSSIDVVRASSLAVKAIESAKPLTAATPKVAKKAPSKVARLRLLARR